MTVSVKGIIHCFFFFFFLIRRYHNSILDVKKLIKKSYPLVNKYINQLSLVSPFTVFFQKIKYSRGCNPNVRRISLKIFVSSENDHILNGSYFE